VILSFIIMRSQFLFAPQEISSQLSWVFA